MDPPYDPYETYMAWNLFLLQHFYEKWPQSCVLLWFPYLDDDQVAGLYQRLQLLRLDDVLVAEFGVQETETLETSGRVAGECWDTPKKTRQRRYVWDERWSKTPMAGYGWL